MVKPILTTFCLAAGYLLAPLAASDSVDDRLSERGWHKVWSDEFDAAEIDLSQWSFEQNCWGGGNGESQCYTNNAKNAYVEEGILKLVARRETVSGAAQNEDSADYDPALTVTKGYSSARLRTLNKGDWTYGRFEIRAKLPSGQGTWPAIWMLPTDYVYGGWAASGEIDIVEAVNLGTRSDAADAEDGERETRVHGSLHYGQAWPNNVHSGSSYRLPNGASPAEAFHRYAMEWQAGEIRWYVDDVHYATARSAGWYSQYQDQHAEWVNGPGTAPFDQAFHLILNLAVGGAWAGAVNQTGIDAAAFPQTLAVDYVRVYQCREDKINGRGCGASDSRAEVVLGHTAPALRSIETR
ncbi:glycoside hydrolase family 16 protein [Reinekea forsetii]|uniref:Glucan endo-1,3-beta-D-glucosidase, GH16 family n=1 Tax=Reinekea forsetii TaxID=1336806 RepID=A0A2K8KRM1_9GAMM|nr:glycoside hydrolase family 16 protein [Reinekea forsetii]ATX76511.1 glucan endo-1,3-beta-D-glucosidase, GH16 family [Reinekea forsetii]